MHWVPGHAGIDGNERADQLANLGVAGSLSGRSQSSSSSSLHSSSEARLVLDAKEDESEFVIEEEQEEQDGECRKPDRRRLSRDRNNEILGSHKSRKSFTANSRTNIQCPIDGCRSSLFFRVVDLIEHLKEIHKDFDS